MIAAPTSPHEDGLPTLHELRIFADGDAGRLLDPGRAERIQRHLDDPPCPVCNSVVAMPAGILDRFKMERLLGQGGAGSVWKAWDEKLRRVVAVKLVHLAGIGDPAWREQVLEEARVQAGIDREGFVPVYEVVEDEESDACAIVMKCVEGGTLADRLGAPIRPRQAATLLAPVARAAQHVNDKSFIHRDIKPSNILIGKDGKPRLIDFSIALRRGDPGVGAGTRSYMAPEQIQGRNLDAATDVWALGVILYEMLNGRRPFTGSSDAEIAERIVKAEVPAFERGVPESLAKICRRCLSVEGRYDSPGDLAEALDAWVRGILVRRGVLATLFGLALTALGIGWTVPIPVWRRAPKLIPIRDWPEFVASGQHLSLTLDGRPGPKAPLKTCRISAGGRLAIRGSGRLEFGPGQGIIAEGVVEVFGASEKDSITLAPADPATPWNGVVLQGNGADKSYLKNVVITGAGGFLSSFEIDPRHSLAPDRYERPPLKLVAEGDERAHKRILRRGGGVLLTDCRGVTFEAVTFRGNRAHQAGALFVYSTQGIKLLRCLFEENRAGGQKLGPGGALFAQNNQDLTIDVCRFLRNCSAGDTYSCGGAIYAGLNNALFTVTNSHFEGNFARYVGGAIYCFQDDIHYVADKAPIVLSRPTLRVTGCTFQDNGTAFWIWEDMKKADYAPGNDLYIDDGYGVIVSATRFTNAQSPGPLIVARAKEASPCEVHIADSEVRGTARPGLVFPHWAQASAKGLSGGFPALHAQDKVYLSGVKDLSPEAEADAPLAITQLPLPESCFKRAESPRKIDTVVIHYASALNWNKVNDKQFNGRIRADAVRRHPELARMTTQQRTFSPLAVRAIFEAYGVGSHYMIDREGRVYELVPIRDIAWHAGTSRMPKRFDPTERTGVNGFSVGIELIATDPKDDPRVIDDTAPGVDTPDLAGPNPAYTIAQYRSLRRLLREVSKAENVDLKFVVGHDEVALGRKSDPGRLFDWAAVRTKDGTPSPDFTARRP